MESDYEQLYNIVMGLLIRVSSMERLLIDNEVINQDKYTDLLSGSVGELKNSLIEAQKAAERNKN